VAVLRHAAVNRDGGVVDRRADGIGDRDAHRLHPAGAKRPVGLERRGELALCQALAEFRPRCLKVAGGSAPRIERDGRSS
jgi:hypothetical protein